MAQAGQLGVMYIRLAPGPAPRQLVAEFPDAGDFS